jgi:hypothetical protein
MVTTPLPGGNGPSVPPTLSGSLQPLPCVLFGSSPRLVASGVTRGEKKEETRVHLVHVRDSREICSGIIGIVETKKFCASHPSLCEHRLTHSKRKFDLEPNTLYVMSSKKRAMHATLLPKLDENCIPFDKALVDLLDDERPIAMWHVYFDGRKMVEESTGRNKLDAPSDVSWEVIARPLLEDLERANNFKTPRKVCIMPGFRDPIITYKMEAPGQLDLLDLSGLLPINGAPTPSQKAVRQIFEGWDVIKENLDVIWSKVATQDDQAKGDMAGIRAQLQEAIYYLNDIGAKSRLLSAKLGRNPQAEAEGDSTVWQALSKLYRNFKAFKAATEGDSASKREMLAKLGKQDLISMVRQRVYPSL